MIDRCSVCSILLRAFCTHLYLSSPKVFKNLNLLWLNCSDKGKSFCSKQTTLKIAKGRKKSLWQKEFELLVQRLVVCYRAVLKQTWMSHVHQHRRYVKTTYKNIMRLYSLSCNKTGHRQQHSMQLN